jgi:hypothetical protein
MSSSWSSATSCALRFSRRRGDWAEAASFHERALELSRRVADRRGEALALFGLYAATAAGDNLALAKQYAGEAAAVAEEVRDKRTAGEDLREPQPGASPSRPPLDRPRP